MATVRTTRRSAARKRRRKRRFSFARLWPGAPLRRRWSRAFRRAPRYAQVLIAVTSCCCSLGDRELDLPGDPQADRTVLSGERHAEQDAGRNVAGVRPDLPRACDGRRFHAGVSRGARAGGGFRQSGCAHVLALVVHAHPFDVYRPASSAVGMYQFTDGTFDEAREFCIHDHRVVRTGRGTRGARAGSTWLYTRVVPSQRDRNGVCVSRRERGAFARASQSRVRRRSHSARTLRR